MKGPPPKDPKVRQRMNKSPTRATLPPESETAKLKVPPIPKKNGGWTEQAQQAWYQIWRSPMAARYLKADFFRIEVLIDLVDRYWRGQTELAAQIRLEGDSFATSPLARRRLEWEIRDQEEAVAVGDGRPAPKTRRDTMNVLRGDFKK